MGAGVPPASIDVEALVAERADVLLLTLDTLRYDVARDALAAGRTPNLASILPNGWEERHTPASFTLAAHQAFFAGFLPTPAVPGRHRRLFAMAFEGSVTTGPGTCVLDAPELVTGLADRGYYTVCVGGTGFFNQRTPLGRVLPSLFHEAWWDESLGVTDPDSTANQVAIAVSALDNAPPQPVLLFVNISAIHQPNRRYVEGAAEDSLETHAAALAYVDSQLPPLFAALRRRGRSLCVITSDHGTAYGEDGHVGHRIGHPVVWTVPYAELVLEEA